MSNTVVTSEQAKVYRAGSRRFFTKNAAYNHAAREKIKSRCDCGPVDDADFKTGYMHYCCRYHTDYDYLVRLQARLCRWYKHIDKVAKQATQ